MKTFKLSESEWKDALEFLRKETKKIYRVYTRCSNCGDEYNYDIYSNRCPRCKYEGN